MLHIHFRVNVLSMPTPCEKMLLAASLYFDRGHSPTIFLSVDYFPRYLRKRCCEPSGPPSQAGC